MRIHIRAMISRADHFTMAYVPRRTFRLAELSATETSPILLSISDSGIVTLGVVSNDPSNIRSVQLHDNSLVREGREHKMESAYVRLSDVGSGAPKCRGAQSPQADHE